MPPIITPRERGLYKISEAAKLCGVSKRTMQRWIDEHDLKTVFIGGRVFIHRKTLEIHVGPEAAAALGIDVPTAFET